MIKILRQTSNLNINKLLRIMIIQILSKYNGPVTNKTNTNQAGNI